MKEKYEGRIFDSNRCGKFKALKYVNASNVLVQFLDTGYMKSVRSDCIRDGRVFDPNVPTFYKVGFMGDGEYKFSVKGKTTKEGKTWNGMLYRCYRDVKYYEDVKVCDNWHNFQNFASWFNQTYPKDGSDYQLDKDLIGNGKLYSPETCSWLKPNENLKLAICKNIYFFISPEGITHETNNLSEFCREHNLTVSAMHNVFKGKRKSHKGWNSKI